MTDAASAEAPAGGALGDLADLATFVISREPSWSARWLGVMEPCNPYGPGGVQPIEANLGMAMAGMRTLLAAALMALVLTAILPPPGAHACSCVEPLRGEVAAWLDEADGAFVGRPTSKAEPTPGPDGSWSSDQLVDMAFEVESVAKGQIGPVLVLQTEADGASCGVEDWGRMAVLVRGSQEVGWRSDLCSVVPVDVLAAVADLHQPSPSSSPPPEAPSPPLEARDATPETSRAAGMPLMPVVAGLVLLVLVGLLVARSRTS